MMGLPRQVQWKSVLLFVAALVVCMMVILGYRPYSTFAGKVFGTSPTTFRSAYPEAAVGRSHDSGSPKAPSPAQVKDTSCSQPLILPKLHQSVRVAASCPTQPLKYKDCVPLPESPRPGTVICVYPAKDDIYVSAELKAGKLFESSDVKTLIKEAVLDEDSQLVDFGMNIGVYTMFAAAAGKYVLAVEMLPANVLQVQHSLQLSGLTDKVTIVNNALYDSHIELTANFIKGNVGASYVNTSHIDFKSMGMVEDKVKSEAVKTICIDDLIPLLVKRKVVLKMDIERAEARALRCAYNFFKTVDVKLIFMEWQAKNDLDRRSITAFMDEFGFVASLTPHKVTPVDLFRTRTNNVYFLKQKKT